MFFLISQKAHSFNFNETIEEYSAKNSGIVSAIYILNRCSGVFTYTSSMLLKEPGQYDKAMNLLKNSNKSIDFASKLYSKHHNTSYEKASEISLNRMMKMDQMYREDAKELFVKNGGYLTGHVIDDLGVCSATLQGF
tara:strand:- start:122 stop:532 length:411 start_codon:yes stop_codon:yes gene_type:complete